MFLTTVLIGIFEGVCAKIDSIEESNPSNEGRLVRTNIPTMEVAIRSQKVFRFAFNPNLFGWSNSAGAQEGVSRHLYSYQPSLKGLPDMPYWMRYKYSHRHKAGKIKQDKSDDICGVK